MKTPSFGRPDPRRPLDRDELEQAKRFLFDRTDTRPAGVDAELDRRLVAMLENQRRRVAHIGSRDDTAIEPAPRPTTGAETSAPQPAIELSAASIRRARGGWRASCRHRRGFDSRFVSDDRYGGYVRAFVEAIDVRDRFHRARGLPIPREIRATIGGQVFVPDVAAVDQGLVVRWQGQQHEVTGEDAEEIATEVALDLFVEYLLSLPLASSSRSNAEIPASSRQRA